LIRIKQTQSSRDAGRPRVYRRRVMGGSRRDAPATPIHLALRALGEAGLIAAPLAAHALTVGAIGGLTLAMMTRAAKGHTGLPLEALCGDIACYVLVLTAAVARVFGPMVAPERHVAWVLGSAALWSSAYALYAARHAPLLTRPRRDRQPG
jgi:uncharacterized protein involved in response to NO